MSRYETSYLRQPGELPVIPGSPCNLSDLIITGDLTFGAQVEGVVTKMITINAGTGDIAAGWLAFSGDVDGFVVSGEDGKVIDGYDPATGNFFFSLLPSSSITIDFETMHVDGVADSMTVEVFDLLGVSQDSIVATATTAQKAAVGVETRGSGIAFAPVTIAACCFSAGDLQFPTGEAEGVHFIPDSITGP